jgi:hypothetical protein
MPRLIPDRCLESARFTADVRRRLTIVVLLLLAAGARIGAQEPAVGPSIAAPSFAAEEGRSLLAVAGESLAGPLRPDAWRPLGFATLFTEGWDEPYAPAPGDAPRQTWVNNADGAFYRLFVFSFAFARDLPGGGDAYNGSYFLFTPLSRRFELGWFVPFVASAPDASTGAGQRNWTDFGDLTIAPRVLLAEDRRYSATANLFVRLPTGDARNGNGAASLSPDLEFWANPAGRWVVRGGIGATVPTNYSPASARLQRANPWTGFNASPSPFTSFDARLAIGQYITPADAPIFKNLVWYVAANLHTELSGGNWTYFSLTPGFRFGLGRDWYALGGLEVPLVGPSPFETQAIFQAIKNF